MFVHFLHLFTSPSINEARKKIMTKASIFATQQIEMLQTEPPLWLKYLRKYIKMMLLIIKDIIGEHYSTEFTWQKRNY
jgi:hypothetical protein